MLSVFCVSVNHCKYTMFISAMQENADFPLTIYLICMCFWADYASGSIIAFIPQRQNESANNDGNARGRLSTRGHTLPYM